jgi:hypothetical protein
MKIVTILLGCALAFVMVYAHYQHQRADLYQRAAAEWKDLEVKERFVKDGRITLLESERTEIQNREAANTISRFMIDRSCIGGPRIGESIEDYAKRYKAVYGVDFPQ